MVNEPLRLGLLADDSAGLGELVSQLRGAPHSVVCSVLIRKHSLPLRSDVDAWLLRVREPSEESELVMNWLLDRDHPYLMDDASAGRVSIESLVEKIQEVVLARKHGLIVKSQPNKVWVLAASTGGPEAVGGFLKTLGSQVQSDAFIYAQHIESHSLPALKSSVKTNAALNVDFCASGLFIEAGHIYIVDPLRAFEITQSGRFVLGDETWAGVYQPSINQVIAKVARRFRERSGAIIFTGMGDDGADSSRIMQAVGGQVFAQSLDSCTVDSMPRSVEEKLGSVYSGSVEELAHKVVDSARPRT